jgi:DNA polymerase-3 subunit gamma/tau
MLNTLTELEPRFKRSGQQQLLLETTLVRLALLDRTVDIEALLRSLGGSAPANDASAQGRPESRSVGPPSRLVTAPQSPAADSRVPVARRAEPTMEMNRPIQSSAQPLPAPVDIEASELAPLDANGLTGKWDDLVSRLRQSGKTLIATALEHATPAAVTARGDITIALDEPNDFFAKAIQNGASDIAAILREWYAPVGRIGIAGAEGVASGPPKRLTDEMVRAEKLAALKKRDPVLASAIEELDLEVID